MMRPEQKVPSTDALPSGLRILSEFLILSVLMLTTPLVIYLDTRVFGGAVHEDSLTELMHNFYLGVASVCYLLASRKIVAARGYLIIGATIFGCMFIREIDFLLDNIVHGLWLYPVLALLGWGGASAYRHRATIVLPLRWHLASREGVTLLVGMALLLFFTRTFGSGSLWRPIMGDEYNYAFKEAFQEGLEYMSYAVISLGAIGSYLSGFGQPDVDVGS